MARFESHSGAPYSGSHAHDFVVLCYFEADGGTVASGGIDHQIRAGDVCVVTPGLVISPSQHPTIMPEGWIAYFPPDAVQARDVASWGGWRAHPLLSAFTTGAEQAAQWLSVPLEQQPEWSRRFADLDRELSERREEYHDAVRAHLALILVACARLAHDVAGGLALRNETLLADVFGYIDNHFSEALSLRDVASALGRSPGHLTTVVRNKTGRTVGEWILERRMSESRRLLTDTRDPIDEVARAVGFPDAAYFSRVFRRHHSTPPGAWRRAARQSPQELPPRGVSGASVSTASATIAANSSG
ncbi:AraC family transcriptional regulator [Hoyosella sp. YIM 151337]|uniref:helix-turn-helix domain-containing protein n=1 Tax=Hoyosella sp. YIM 151337 TaxID=2992742 RepID=UPI0022368CED|nr:AraC family transcriptional regulator [Hoyosella sp. YIM 151337]MCW4351715.1 AraC family transcriptional regulator [Hoyosella sp. YIM 151337]